MNNESDQQIESVVRDLSDDRKPDPRGQAAETSEPKSPTLALLAPGKRPSPPTACEVCPKSLWLSSDKSLKCYCRVMHAITYSSEERTPPLTACDGLLLLDEE